MTLLSIVLFILSFEFRLGENVDLRGISIKHGMTFTVNQSFLEQYYFKKEDVTLRTIFASVNITCRAEKHFEFSSEYEYEDKTIYMLWKRLLFLQSSRFDFISKRISPFEDFHFNISFPDGNNHTVHITSDITGVNKYQLVMFMVGCVIFFAAKYLSRSTVFHYSSGVSIGVLMSWMMILIILYRIIPYKRVMTALLVSGTTLGFYFMESIMETTFYLLSEYPYELLAVTTAFALMSMALIYYFGPPSNERSLNLLQWFLQIIACYCIYQSSYCKEFSVTAVVTVVLMYLLQQFVNTYTVVAKLFVLIIPRKWLSWYFRPPTRVYLTQQQYDEQGVIETEHALKELSKYCSSPKCDSWKVVSRLKEPKKFANFLMDGQQFTAEEAEAYEQFDSSDYDVENDLNSSISSMREEAANTCGNWISEDESEEISLLSSDE